MLNRALLDLQLNSYQSSACHPILQVVGSMDAHPCRYQAAARVQKHHQSIIHDMADMTQLMLREFYQATRFKPVRIIAYRYGVSESRFQKVIIKI